MPYFVSQKKTRLEKKIIAKNCSLPAKHCAKHTYIIGLTEPPQKFCKVDIMIILTFHMQKVTIREVR